jgi:Protein of unknown function (DUF3987)
MSAPYTADPGTDAPGRKAWHEPKRGAHPNGESDVDHPGWPARLIEVWPNLDDVCRERLRGPWGQDVDCRARTDLCISTLSHWGLSLDEIIEVATVFPDGMGKVRDGPGGIGKFIRDLWSARKAEAIQNEAKVETARAARAEAATRLFDPWADPPPPEFPGGVLSREMQDAVFATALRNGFCPGVLAMAYLAAASGAASKASRFAPYANSTWWVPPVVWVMPIADSGQRKTAIEDIAFAALRDVHGKVWGNHRARMQAWKAIPEKERREIPKPAEPHSFVVEDITVEKLQEIVALTDRGTAMIRDEIAGMLEFGRYTSGKGAAERAYYLQMYEGGIYTVSRIGRDSFHITVNAVMLYGAIQPDRLKDFKGLEKDGLLQRTNMVRASAASVSRDDVVIRGADAIYNKIEALTRIEAQRYTTTKDGSALIRETEILGQKLATIPDLGAGFQGTCSKLHGTHARYALILHLLDDPIEPIIPAETISRAGILVREFLLPHARDFFGGLTGSAQQRLRDVAGWILTRPDEKQRFLASDITSGVWACPGLGTKELGDVLDPLVTGGWLEPEAPFPSNRAWDIDPELRAVLADRRETERHRREEVRQTLNRIGRKTPPYRES